MIRKRTAKSKQQPLLEVEPSPQGLALKQMKKISDQTKMKEHHEQMKTGRVGFQKHHQVQYNNGTFLSQPLTRSSFTESTLINDQITTAASTDSCLVNHGLLNEQSGESTTHELPTATQHAQKKGFTCSEFTDQETADRSETTDLRFTDDLKAQLIES